MKASRYDVFNNDFDHLTYVEDPSGEWVMADAHDQVVAKLEAEVERLTAALRSAAGSLASAANEATPEYADRFMDACDAARAALAAGEEVEP